MRAAPGRVKACVSRDLNAVVRAANSIEYMWFACNQSISIRLRDWVMTSSVLSGGLEENRYVPLVKKQYVPWSVTTLGNSRFWHLVKLKLNVIIALDWYRSSARVKLRNLDRKLENREKKRCHGWNVLGAGGYTPAFSFYPFRHYSTRGSPDINV